MAAGAEEKLRSLAEEATCSFCLGYFTDPVSVQCGHTFCTPCITRYWEGLRGGQQGTYPCPQCRQAAPTSTLRPNRQLASIVQILTQGPPVAPPTGGLLACTQHGGKAKLFCGEDQTPVCRICRESRCRRLHTVLLIQKAAQQLKGKLQSCLDDVKRKLENIRELRTEEETKLTDLEGNCKIQGERITTAFNQVQQYLEKERCCHLNHLEEKKKRAIQEIGEKVSELDKQQASAQSHITEIKVKCQLPDEELLKDAKIILSRLEKMKCQPPDSGHCKEIKQEEQQEENEDLDDEEEKEMEEDVEEEEEEEEQADVEEEDLELRMIKSLEWRWARSYAGEVTLDPDTAHRRLILSEDRRSVSLGNVEKDLPDTPERFTHVIIVLGRERLSSGRQYWEVEVGDSEWDLGVCDEFVSRKGAITLSPEDGYWAVWLRDGEYKACTSAMTSLTPSVPPRVVGLFLDYEAGRLSVYNVTDRSLLFTFSKCSFPRTLRPFFSPGTNDGRKNGGALRVLALTGYE